MANLSDILSRPATDFVPPPPLPTGGYHCVVAGLPEQVTSSVKHTPGFRFILKLIDADDDVDATELKEVGGIDGKTLRHDMWISQDPQKEAISGLMLREFLEHCGIEAEGKTLNEMIDEVPNKEVMVYVKHEDNNRGGFRATIAGTGPVDED